MKVRYWNSKQPIAWGTSVKDLVKLIKTNGTVALSVPNGDVDIPQLYFVLGGRGSIDQFLGASGQGRFYCTDKVLAKYLRVNMGMGKHYTIVALGGLNALTTLKADGLHWSDLRLSYPQIPINLNGPTYRASYTLPYSEVAKALRGAEAQLTGQIVEYAGI